MTVDPHVQRLVAAIRAIPREDESPVSIEELCRQAGFEVDEMPAASALLLKLLGSFGVLRTVTSPVAGHLIKAEAPAAALFLQSLAEYLLSDQSLLDNWSRAGTFDPPYTGSEVLAGPQFLYLIESRRLRANPHAPAIRWTEVAQVVISRKARGQALMYLTIHDPAARQYQLPGGHRRPGDTDMRDTAIREMEEELDAFTFDPGRDRIVELGTIEINQVSRTYGVVTAYKMTFFHLRTTRPSLQVGPHARWVAESTLLSEDAQIDGQTLNLTGLHRLNKMLPGGIKGLEPSFQVKDHGWMVTTATTRPLEFWGLVVAVLGLAASVVFFLLT